MGNTQSSENATAGIVNKALAEVFRFIELCEEIRQSKQKGHSFVKVYDNVKKDWEQNHFLANTKDEPDRGKKDENPKTKASASSSQKKKKDTDEQFGVFVTSYQLKQWNEEKATFGEADGCDETLIVNKGENNSKFWLKIEEPIYRVPPSGTSSRWALQKCLTKLEAENPEMFERNAELSAELSRLKQENLAPPSSIADDEWQEANEYVNYLRKLSTQQKAAPLYKKLHQWIGREDQGASELALGFGHARMLVEDKDQCKMVNGPLFEVLVNAEWHEDHENGRRFIAVLPEDNVSVKLNVQVMDALMSDVGNKETLKRLNEWARQKEVGSLCPGNAQTFLSFLDTATKLRWNSNLRMSNDRGVHTFPEDPESLVLTAAWCLYSSSKKSSTFSRDAALLAKALDKGAVNITTGRELDKGAMIAPSAVFPLILGPDALEDGEANSIQLDELPLPLPATPSQKKVVEKLFENDHVLVVDGPPGTGKTHTIVNCVAVGLYLKLQVLLTSTNPRALRAFWEKLPPELQKLCVDFSSCVEGGMSGSHQTLETLCADLRDINERKDEIRKKIEEYRTKIDQKIRALSDLDCAVEKDCDNKRRLLEENGYLDMLERICEISEKHFLIFKSACANDNIDDVFEELKNLVAIKKIECGEHMSFSYEDEVTDDLIGYAKFEAAMTQFRVENVDQKKLSKLFVDGKCPVSVDQWSRVVRGLVVQEAECSFRKKYILPLIQQGCHETDIYDTRQGAFADGILEVMKLGKDLASSINGSNWGRDHLKKLFTAKPGNTLSQERRRKLVDEIQDLEAKLVLSKAMYEMSNSMSKQDLSELNKLTQQVGAVKNNMEKDSNSPGKGSARSQRYQNEYAAAIKKIVKIIPFLVMTPEQVSRYVPADHRFGLGIIDEASQSDFTAVNIMVRCSKFLVVGDDKQVSPNEGGLSEKSLGFLNASLPNIENSQQLLPRFSFFDLCKVIYPTKHVFLTEHFRCPPEIIAFSNKQFYRGNLEPLRLPVGPDVLVDDVRIKDGKVDDKKKVNELECEAIANFVYDAIKTAAESGCSPRSIGIISMAGAAQCKAIQECLERKIDSLRIELDDGPERIEQHNIICGEPAQFQGAERDIILLSVVRDASCIFKEIDPQRRKQWNVAMTRAMYKMILFRSFDIGDIQDKNDIKRDTFRFFISARRARELSRNSSPTQATLECCIEDDKMDQCKRVRTKIENRLVSTLESRGFSLVRKGGNIWAGALCVGNQGRPKTERALLCIENCGESKEEWIKLVEQQTTLERTGRACLRVDGISLALNFDASLAEILQYLKTAGLSVSVPLPSEKALPTTAPVAAIFTTREATDSSSGSSEVDSSTNNTKRKVSACSNSDYDTDGSSNGDNILDSDTSSNADHRQPPAKPSVAAPTGRKSEVAASDKPGNEKSKARKRNPNSASAGPARRSTRQRTT